MKNLIETFLDFFNSNSTIFLYCGCLGMCLFLWDDMKKRSSSALRKGFDFLLMSLIAGFTLNYMVSFPLELQPQNLSSKTYLVTGCTPGGIGYEIANVLLEWNASIVICTVRNEAKAEQLIKAMPLSKNGKLQVELLELDDFSSVQRAGRSLNEKYPKFDGVIFNAGLMPEKRQITKDGFEEMFQVNHLSQHLLFQLIENHMAKNSRVLFISSVAYYFLGTLDREIYSKKPGGRQISIGSLSIGQEVTYADTKLMQILLSRELAKKYSDKSIVFNSACPGFVATNFQDKIGPTWFGRIASYNSKLFGRNLREGASRPLQIMTYPEYSQVTGTFFPSYVPMPLSSQVTDSNSKWLVEKSEELTKKFLN